MRSRDYKSIANNLSRYHRNSGILSKALFTDKKFGCPKSLYVLILAWSLVYCSHISFNHINRSVSLISKWFKNNGVPNTIETVKGARLLITRWMVDQPLVGNHGIRLVTDSTGWPVRFAFLKPSKDDISAYREVLSLINILRAIQGVKPVSLKDITDKPSVNLDWLKELEWDISYLAYPFKRKTPTFTKFHLSTKRGPNGHAIVSIWQDWKGIVIYSDLLRKLGGDELMVHFNNFGKIIGSKNGETIRDLFKISNEGSSLIGKIVGIPAPEGKTRTIAQLSYWFQSALIPLHEDIFRILKQIPEDCTFNQGKAQRHLKKSPSHHYHSLDLKSATDRFPIQFQKMVLTHIYSQSYADAWVETISLPFDFEGKEIKWETGQPIGSYSSWAVFALSHHILIRWCFRKLNISWHNNYVVLGDDVVICNDAAAGLYTEMLTRMGVEVAKTKTHVSKHSFEFAKRWYRDCKGEFSPFQFSALTAAGPRSSQVCEYLIDIAGRGWVPKSISIPRATALIVSAIAAKLNWNHIVKSVRMAASCWWVISYLKGHTPGVSMVRNLQGLWGVPELSPSMSTTHYCGDGIINNVVVEIFSISVEQQEERDFRYMSNFVPIISELVGDSHESLSAYSACFPHLSVEEQIESQLEAVMARAFEFDSIYSGCWDLTMRSLSTPDPTTVFSIRQDKVRQLYISKIVVVMIDRIKLIAQLGILVLASLHRWPDHSGLQR